MHRIHSASSIHTIRPIDLASIEAVGFDLDHTLALYDDHAINLMAVEETIDLLVDRRGYSRASLAIATEPTPAARGLSLDLRHGNVVKIGADGRVTLARRASTWLDQEAIRRQYQDHDPADERLTWHVHSPFDTPTLWFFGSMGPLENGARSDESATVAHVLTDIRTMLDVSHTRGDLKAKITRELDRFVAPAGAVADGLDRWARSGKRLFVVTNSDRDFATNVLDAVIGSRWTSIFGVVVTDAGKPGFFHDPSRPGSGVAVGRGGSARVLDHSSAAAVEAALGVPAGSILYVGDNTRSDVVPARAHGWRTAHVVAELDQPVDPSPWAGPLHHHGAPTWFTRVIRDHADLACARVDQLLDLDPRSIRAADADFFDRVVRGVGS